MRSRAVWCVPGLAVVAFVLDTVFTAAHHSLWSEATWAAHGWPLIPLSGVGCALMGTLVLSRHPRQPLGWLLCVASLISTTLAAEAYGDWVLHGGGPGPAPAAHAAGWAGSLLGWPAFTAIVLVFLFAPDGRLLSPRWRWAVLVVVGGMVLHTLGTLTIRPGEFVYGEQYGTSTLSGPLLVTGVALVAAGLLASAVSLVLRLRRARDDARRQLLWIASSAVFLAVGVAVVLAVPPIQGEEKTWLAALPLGLAQVAFPLAVAVAVLRHRLVPIDLVVNRATALTLATALVAAGYVLVVVGVGFVVGRGTSGFVPSLAATAVVALLFQPLRGWVVAVADRLAFGVSAAPYEALADFSRRLRDSPDPSSLLPAVADAAARAVGASRVTVVLHVEAGEDWRAVWPPFGLGASTPDLEVPVVDAGQRLGSLAVTMPAGRPLRPRDERLLADLAEQAATAFRTVRLTAELSAQVDQLAHRTRELTRSRRRLITAGDAERSRLAQALGRSVLLHLAPLPARLEHLARADGAPAREPDALLLAQSADSLQVALEQLRELTRGVFPAQLSRSGLPAALGSLLARTRPDARLVVHPSAEGQRFDPRAEAATYFCVSELSRDLGRPLVVSLSRTTDRLRIVVTGRGRGCAPGRALSDRVEAAGGVVSCASGANGDDVVDVRLPVGDARSAGGVEPRRDEPLRVQG